MFALFLCTFLIIGVNSNNNGEESRIIYTSQGPVRGYKDPKINLFAFRNIPYATTPTGKDRFKAPLPAPTWKQPFDAIDRQIICPQVTVPNFVTETMNMQEDCLVANVYIPDTNQTDLPVYVIVHGGGYQAMFGDLLKPTNMIRENNIVAVTFNYRVGAHGFLCLGTEDAPGNAGMKDQVALLRWVKKNIASFGGNPNDVTIGGCSAGGSAVDLLTISKSAEGLFHKAIPESGSNVGSWTIQADPIENAKQFAATLNFTELDNFEALVEFYKIAPFETLQTDSIMSRPGNDFPFAPCVESFVGEEIFLDDHPVNILSEGNYKKVPLLYGFAEMEGLIKSSLFNGWKDLLNDDFAQFLPNDLKFKNTEERTEVAIKIKEFYFGNKSIDDSGIVNYLKFVGDVMFAYPHLRSTRLRLESGHDQIFLYEYSFVDENDPVIPNTEIRKANHCQQLISVCDGETPMKTDVELTEEFKNMSKIMKQLWANFIKTGNPIVEGSPLESWPAVSNKHGAPYMSLGNSVQLVHQPLAEDRVSFWDQIYDKYYKEPLSPKPLTKIKRVEL